MKNYNLPILLLGLFLSFSSLANTKWHTKHWYETKGRSIRYSSVNAVTNDGGLQKIFQIWALIGMSTSGDQRIYFNLASSVKSVGHFWLG